jgi:hypothetical protein
MSRITEIYDQIKLLNEEIELIRSRCLHNTYHIGMFSWRVGSMEEKRICCECHKPLGDPSDEELKEYRDEMKMLESKKLPIGVGSKIYKNN